MMIARRTTIGRCASHAPRRLAVESLEQRQLLAADLPLADFASPILGEGEGNSCSAFARVEQVQVSGATPVVIEVLFNGAMEVEEMISDGTIVDAVELVDLQTGPLTLTADQFNYDATSDTLTWTASQ